MQLNTRAACTSSVYRAAQRCIYLPAVYLFAVTNNSFMVSSAGRAFATETAAGSTQTNVLNDAMMTSPHRHRRHELNIRNSTGTQQ